MILHATFTLFGPSISVDDSFVVDFQIIFGVFPVSCLSLAEISHDDVTHAQSVTSHTTRHGGTSYVMEAHTAMSP